MSDLSYELAKLRIRRYRNESEGLLQTHREAMECRDCEDYLQQGLDALDCVRKADALLREADYEGIFEYSEEVREAIRALYAEWLVPCEYAEELIQKQFQRGYQPDNLEKFRTACEVVRDTVERTDWQEQLRFKDRLEAEPW